MYENNITQPQRVDILAFRDNLKDKGRKPTTIKATLWPLDYSSNGPTKRPLPNIAEKIKGAKLDQAHKKDYLTVDRIKDVLNNIDTSTLTGARDYAIIVLMVTGGLRTIEVSRADMDDMRNVGNSPRFTFRVKVETKNGICKATASSIQSDWTLSRNARKTMRCFIRIN